MMRRTALSSRKTLRRDEPTPTEKAEARLHCYERAGGMCERCGKPTAWAMGHLHHVKARRRWGWMESADQQHEWLCAKDHYLTHNPKPVPKAEWRAL